MGRCGVRVVPGGGEGGRGRDHWVSACSLGAMHAIAHRCLLGSSACLGVPQEIAVGTDRFAIPEVLFNPALLSGYPHAAAMLAAAGGGGAEGGNGLQGIQHLAHDCISK